MEKMRDLETIAVLRATAKRYRGLAYDLRRELKRLEDKKTPEVRAMSTEEFESEKKVMVKDLEAFVAVAIELEEIANDTAHFRAHTTARYLTGPRCTLPKKEAQRLLDVIAATGSFMEYASGILGEGDNQYRYKIRMIRYYDATMEAWRWALEYSDGRSVMGASDNADQEDATYRYWEAAEAMGAKRP